MKFGLIGGIGPQSTAKYYDLIIQGFRRQLNTDDYPQFTIRSINMTEMLGYVFDNQYDELTDFLLNHIAELHHSGVQIAALASNTPHIVFDRLSEKSPIKLISIVEETCKKIQSDGLNRVALFGTSSTMTAGFYNQTAKQMGIDIVVPNEESRDFIHAKYFEELVFNEIKNVTKKRLIEIALELKLHDRVQGLILGGTELSLILSQVDFVNLTVYDTTQIHVDSIVRYMVDKTD